MAKWQHIREARGIAEGTTADLLMPNGKVVAAIWEARPGTLGNCPGNKGEKILTAMVAWWLIKGKWRGKEMIGLYEPLSFRLAGE
ncbi:hypothetical protein [Rhizobium sp. 11515TR]|uniref:hypothetical protein n=1 Tax=Rhizobium sp. 11515TR TaxID=2028343 RepID=UPI000BA8A879|nr:hypothetical protein [Rhizobium sp. 11515TR]ASW06289.1 hypothetical protein CKA34_10610 [Rhizobium sp. 11515TR]